LSFQFGGASFWVWQTQVVVFLVLSVLSAIIGKRILVTTRGDESDQPLLNRREEQLVGRTATLEEPIVNGSGRIRLGDTLWRVNGPELPAGTRVKVARAHDGQLFIEPVE
jgi:inner membrane protein